jgi:mono/diheme cytochrome c family protein
MKVTVLAVVLIALTACGGPGSGTEIPPQDAGLVAEGSELFAANCAQCHGADLRGTEKGPSFLSPIYRPGHHSDASFLLAVQTGVRAHHWQFGNMPPAEGVTPADVAAIVAFVRETQRLEGFEP